jgi:hypothetical protein
MNFAMPAKSNLAQVYLDKKLANRLTRQVLQLQECPTSGLLTRHFAVKYVQTSQVVTWGNSNPISHVSISLLGDQ